MARVRGAMWFAWYPVHTSKGWRWLETVFRDVIIYDDGTVTVRHHSA